MDKDVNNEKQIKILLSNHAKERYAERIMKKDNKSDIAVYIARNEDKIYNDVSMMVNYGNLIFNGLQADSKSVKVYQRDTWMVILDSKTHTVITLYKIELGAGDELDRLYVEKMIAQIQEYKQEELEAEKQLEEDNNEYKKIIEDLERQVVEYRKSIKEMEALIGSYKETIQNSGARLIETKSKIAAVLNKMLSKKHF